MGLSEKIDGLFDVGKLVANWFPAVFGCLRASQEQMAEKKCLQSIFGSAGRKQKEKNLTKLR